MSVDIYLVEAINQFARTFPTFDVIVATVTHTYLFKGGVMMIFLWWGWFRESPSQDHDRQALLATLMACFASLVTARVLALSLPHRLRPMHDGAVDMVLPIGVPPGSLTGWSSFPSDHAALFGCIASGMFLVSRKAGVFATLYCITMIMLPRVYTGLHYVSDLLAGYTLGTAFVWLASRGVFFERVVRPVYVWFMNRPGLWYPLFFLVSLQIVTLFDELRILGALALMIVQKSMTGVELG